MAETGRLCRHSPSAHSSVDLGVVLRISFAAGPISPFTNSARREKIERIRVFSFRVFATFFFSNPRSNFSHVLLCVSVAVTSALIPRHFFFPRSEEGGVGARLAHFFSGRKLAVFVQSFDRLGFLCCARSMGAQISKTAGKEEAAVEKPAEGAAVAAKSNGQVNEMF